MCVIINASMAGINGKVLENTKISKKFTKLVSYHQIIARQPDSVGINKDMDARLSVDHIVVNGRGSTMPRKAIPLILGDFNLKITKQKFRELQGLTDPFIKFSPEERFVFAVLRQYKGNFINFLNDFWAQRKRPIIKKIYNFILNKYKFLNKSQIKSDKKFKKNIKIENYINNFNLLEDESADSCEARMASLPIKEEKIKINFMQKDYVLLKRLKNRRERKMRSLKKAVKAKFSIGTFVCRRNQRLLQALRRSILDKRMQRATKSARYNLTERYIIAQEKFLNNYINCNNNKIVPQMDIDAHGEDITPVVDKTSNVVNETQRQSSQAVPAMIPTKQDFKHYASAESSEAYADLIDRWFPVSTFEWSEMQARGTNVYSIVLPRDVILNHPDASICVPFKSYAYWDGDIEVKLMINANKFQIGQLQMAWYYGYNHEFNSDRRDNVQLCSQQAHCLISAACSNEARMYIPFRYYKPKMGVKNRSDDPDHLDLGTLTIRVLNQLLCTSTTYSKCFCTLSIRFVNSNFSGMCARDLGTVQPQMMSMVRSALNMLTDISQDPQRDNPPSILPATTIVPNIAHSWSFGDKAVDPVNVLRLQAPGQTPHPAEVTPEFDEMSIDYVKNIYGLVHTIEWKSDQQSGTRIYQIEGSPNIDFNHVDRMVYDGSVCYMLPPITVLANLFAYWRGSIELRLDVIASQFHTGKLLVAYIPRILANPTMHQALSSPHQIFDLQGENRQFNFTIPYITDRPWWMTSSFGERTLPPSYVYIFVLNQLIPMDQVPDKVYINCYIRGGYDFELSVPCAPRLGLSTFNAYYYPTNTDLCNTKAGYTPMYIGSWRYLDGGKKQILRYGEVTDHVVQMENMMYGVVYEPDKSKNNNKDIIEPFSKSKVWYIVKIAGINDGFEYASVFTDYKKAEDYVRTRDNSKLINYNSNSDYFKDEDGNNISTIIWFKRVENKTSALLSEALEGQMDERQMNESSVSVLPSARTTGGGLYTFGEQFIDLKSLCRRYQLLYSYKNYINVVEHNQFLKLPVLPQGLWRSSTQISIEPWFNYNREGTIPIVASAFRFYRGGLRYRLVWRGSKPVTITVEHRPDERMTGWILNPERGHRSLRNNGYAIVMQNTAINNVIEFEIPFYQSGLLGLLQHPQIKDNLESYHFTLGNLYFSITGLSTSASVVFDLYYSLADDCRFSVFQGFPSMMRAPDYSLDKSTKLTPQMGLFDVNVFGDKKEKVDSIIDKVDRTMTTVEELVAPKSAPTLSSEIGDINGEPSFIGLIEDFCYRYLPVCARQIMLSALSNLVHLFIAPTFPGMIWGLASFLLQTGFLMKDSIVVFSKSLFKMFDKYREKVLQVDETNPLIQTDEKPVKLVPQMETEEDGVTAAITGTVATAILATMGSAASPPKNMPDFCRRMWNGAGKFAATANGFQKFFTLNLKWIKELYLWIVKKFFPDKKLAHELEGADVELKRCIDECQILLDSSNNDKIYRDPSWNIRVYANANLASILINRLSMGYTPRYAACISIMREMLKKRDELVNAHISPPVRFEPFVIWFNGETNLGKSHICQQLGNKLLMNINYKSYEELIFTKTPGNDFWNGLRNQPICLFDDFLQIKGEHGLTQVMELFALKSKAVFNPPQASIEEKKIRYNPLLVFCASNTEFPQIVGITSEEALYRRRNIMVRVEPNVEFYAKYGLNPKFNSPRDFDRDLIKNYEHLHFYLHNNPRDKNADYGTKMTYNEFVDKINEKFLIFYKAEQLQYAEALKNVYEFYPTSDDALSISDIFERKEQYETNMSRISFDTYKEFKYILLQLATKPTLDRHDRDIADMYLAAIKGYNPKEYEAFVVKFPQFVANFSSVNLADLPSASKYQAQMGFGDIEDDDAYHRRTNKYYQLYADYLYEIEKTYPLRYKTNERCVHWTFEMELEFERPHVEVNEGLKPGYFYDIININKRIPEDACLNCDYCIWSDKKLRDLAMNAWLYTEHAIERERDVKYCRWEYVPKFFIAEDIGVAAKRKEKFLFKLKAFFATASIEINKFSKWLKHKLSVTFTVLWNVLKYSASGMALVVSFTALAGFSTGFFKGMWNKPQLSGDGSSEPQMTASGDPTVYGRMTRMQTRDVAIKTIGQMDTMAEEALLRKIRSNTLFIKVNYKGKELKGRITGIIDKFAIGVSHYHDIFSKLEDATFYLSGLRFNGEIKYSDLKFTPFKNSGLCYYEMPKFVPAFKNILNSIAPQKAHSKISPYVKLLEAQDEVFAQVHDLYADRVYDVKVDESENFKSFTIPEGYSYPKSYKGLCGSVLISTSPNLNTPIIGIHTAGDLNGRHGMSEAITQEQFQHLSDKAKIKDVITGQLGEWTENHIAPARNVWIEGIIPKVLAKRSPEVSRVIPTECHGEIFPVTHYPPVLSPKDVRIQNAPYSPMQAGIDKHGLLTKDFPIEFVKDAYNDLKNLIISKVQPVRGEVGKLSKAVAIVGDPNVANFEKLDFNTSEGFPYVAMRGPTQRSKAWLFGLTETQSGYELNSINNDLKIIMKIKKHQRLNRILPFTLFTDSLKDRKLPLAKITKPGSVRIFSISPVDYTIQTRQYFMDFSVSYQNARFDVEHAVGIDVNSYEWTQLVHILLEKGTKFVTADYSGFGPSLNATCAYYAFKIMREWYKVNGDNNIQNDLHREMIGYEAIYSLHLAHSTVYRTSCGLPSGGPLTVIGNSLVNCLYIRIAWKITFTLNLNYVKIANKYNIKPSLDHFHKHVKPIVYGDDLDMSVSDQVAEDFNCETLFEIFSQHNIGIKNSTKGDEIVPFYNLHDKDKTFLKHNFVVHPFRKGYYLAALDKNSIEDTLNWTFKEWANDLRRISLEASDACIRSAFGHGPIYYNYVRDKVFYYWRKKHEFLTTPAWFEIDYNNFA